jgi:hypothetical protein
MGHIDRFNLKNYIDDYNIDIFIETGTGIGESIKHAVNYYFKNIFTIEIINSLYLNCKEKFKDYKNCHFINDNSKDGLIKVLSDINENDKVLFWLDAHFPGADFGLDSYGGTTDSEKRIPLESELRTINSVRNIRNDVFIIDDLRIYEDGPFEGGIWPERRFLGGNGIDFIYEIFQETHTIEKDYREQGYIICKPKTKIKEK